MTCRLLSTLLVLAACASSDDPQAPAGLDIGATARVMTDDGAFEVAESSSATVTIASASAVLRDIELDLPDGETCAALPPDAVVAPVRCSEDKLHVDGPFVVDLVARTSSPSLDDIVLPSGTYRRLDMRFEPDGSDVSLSVAGTIAVDGAEHELTIELPIREDARFESPGGVVVDGSTSLLAHIDLDVVFAQVPLKECLDDGDLDVIDGAVHVTDRSDCGEVRNAIEEALKESWDLDEHHHDDGEHESEHESEHD